MFYLIISAILSWLFWYIFLKKDPAPIYGIYSQPGKWYFLKYCLFYAAFKLRQRNVLKTQGAGYGVKSKPDISEMDKAQKLPENEPNALDAIYFNASNPEGFYLGAAMARRHNGLAQTFLIVRVPDVGILELPCAPDTHIGATNPETHSAGGLEMTPLEPMKKWSIHYEGEVKLNGEEFGYIELDLIYTACTQYFDYDTDMSPNLLARAIAAEPWSTGFFNRLRSTHQTHYEQFGDYKGHLKIPSQSRTIPLEMRGLRDHSYGVRDWRYFHRYILNFFHLEDGTCAHVGLVSMANVALSHLEFGFLSMSSGQKMSIDRIHPPLYQIGETNHDSPPSEFQFDFTTTDGTHYHVECEVIDRRPYYYGEDWDGIVWEQFAEFVCNGVKGCGLTEWEYRHHDGSPKKGTSD